MKPWKVSSKYLNRMLTLAALFLKKVLWFGFFRYAVDTPGLTIALIIYGITNYVGVWFVLAMIKHFGAAQTVFATSMRKAGSITLSYLLFPKLIIWRHVAGITLVSLGVYLHSLTKTKTGSRAMWYSIRNCFRKYKLRDESSILPL